MSLTAGSRIGPYEVQTLLGAGGMGEVYRARDPRLSRDVALKVLPATLSSDVERLERFEQEARAAAALNHPNILAVHDVGRHDDSPYIVSELLEGETLRERLSGGAVPVRKAVEYAIQIAHGLAAAHEKGIVHRDLKPENVFITTDGRVKILDFGLAKLTETEVARAGASVLPTTPPHTLPGVVLWTIGYMSPEQVRGLTADQRSDIFALGVVLYEMLSGRRAFHGETTIDAMTAILKEDPPDLPVIERHIPPALARIVDRCLEKSPASRFKSADDLAFALEALSGHSGESEAAGAIAAPRNRERLAWVSAGVLLLVGAASVPFAVVHLRETAVDHAIRFLVLAPENSRLTGTPPRISPDGRRLAFVANTRGRTQLWIQRLDSTTAEPLTGTDNADYLFWSPDSRSIAFFAGGKLRKIDASGGPPTTICDAPLGRSGTWNRDGVIVFAPNASQPLYRVSSSGGAPTPVTAIESGEVAHRGASFLPDGVHFLFFVQGNEDKQGIYVGSLQSMDRKLLLLGSSSGVFAPPGYLLFVRERTLMAQRLDVETLQLAGDARPIAGQVGFDNVSDPTISVSDDGVLAHTSGIGGERQLAWFDRAGTLVERIGAPAQFLDVALAPDQRRAAVQWGNSDIRIADLVRAGVPSALTIGSSVEDWPVWSPNGDRILFNSTASGGSDLYWKASTAAGSEELVFTSSVAKRPTDWSLDGRFILFENDDPKSRTDLWVLPLDGDKKPQRVQGEPYAEANGRFSPDGKSIAYVSDESGTPEVYVRTFPGTGGKWKVSTEGGVTPRWRRNGKELFYLSLDRKIMAVDVRAASPAFDSSTPRALFEAPVDQVSAGTGNRYDVSSDGQRFLIGAPVENARSAPITVVMNWTADLK